MVVVGVLRAIEAEELPAAVLERVVELSGKGRVVAGAVAIDDEIMVSWHGMEGCAEFAEGCAQGDILRGFAAVGEVAGHQAECGVRSTLAHFRDDVAEERRAIFVEEMQIVHGDEGEPFPRIRRAREAAESERDEWRGGEAESIAAGDAVW